MTKKHFIALADALIQARPVRREALTMTCSRCNAVCSSSGVATGYGRLADGSILCYQCCADEDRRIMTELGVYTLYLSNGLDLSNR